MMPYKPMTQQLQGCCSYVQMKQVARAVDHSAFKATAILSKVSRMCLSWWIWYLHFQCLSRFCNAPRFHVSNSVLYYTHLDINLSVCLFHLMLLLSSGSYLIFLCFVKCLIHILLLMVFLFLGSIVLLLALFYLCIFLQ